MATLVCNTCDDDFEENAPGTVRGESGILYCSEDCCLETEEIDDSDEDEDDDDDFDGDDVDDDDGEDEEDE
jgi:hypothetical protein